MIYEERFTDAELNSVIEQGMIYMCACPAQVADCLRTLRELLRDPNQCSENPHNDYEVHTAIARRVSAAHETMQRCLDEIVELEKWDRTTMLMPEDLRKRQMLAILSDD